MRFLAVRALSERELATKLRRYEYSAAAIRETIAACRKHGFLNDELLARDGARALSERGSGERMIRNRLRRRGLSGAVVEAALEENAENEPDAARRALEYKLRLLRRETDPRRKREKAFRFLAARGFSAEVIRTVFEEMRAEIEAGTDEMEQQTESF